MSWTLVTGGARGLGKEICIALAEQGRHIVVHYRNSQKEALELVLSLRSLGVQAESLYGDFSTRASTHDFLARYKTLFSHTEALVNNVGNYSLGSALETKPDELEQVLQENLISALILIQGLMPQLKTAQAGGRIINIGSVGCSHIKGSTHAMAYHMSKQALWMLTRSLAKECAPDSVCVNPVCVNMVSPGYLEGSIDIPKDLPTKQLVTFREVARVVAFLMQPASKNITGQDIEVAGGIGL